MAYSLSWANFGAKTYSIADFRNRLKYRVVSTLILLATSCPWLQERDAWFALRQAQEGSP